MSGCGTLFSADDASSGVDFLTMPNGQRFVPPGIAAKQAARMGADPSGPSDMEVDGSTPGPVAPPVKEASPVFVPPKDPVSPEPSTSLAPGAGGSAVVGGAVVVPKAPPAAPPGAVADEQSGPKEVVDVDLDKKVKPLASLAVAKGTGKRGDDTGKGRRPCPAPAGKSRQAQEDVARRVPAPSGPPPRTQSRASSANSIRSGGSGQGQRKVERFHIGTPHDPSVADPADNASEVSRRSRPSSPEGEVGAARVHCQQATAKLRRLHGQADVRSPAIGQEELTAVTELVAAATGLLAASVSHNARDKELQ
jgi:hypothetical protein